MPSATAFFSKCVEVVEIMQVVEPELVPGRVVPVGGSSNFVLRAEKCKPLRPEQADWLWQKFDGCRRGSSHRWRRPQVWARAMQPKPQPAIDLDRLEVAQGMKVFLQLGYEGLRDPAIVAKANLR